MTTQAFNTLQKVNPMIDEQHAPAAQPRRAKHRRETPVQWLTAKLSTLHRTSRHAAEESSPAINVEWTSAAPSRYVEDETMSLPIVQVAPTERKQITETTPEHTRNQLLDTLDAHLERIRELASTQDAEGTRERIHGAIVALYQLDANVAETARKARESETAEQFDDWARGGEDA